MDLKFYLNKVIKVDNIENYTIKSLLMIKDNYDKFLENTEGIDPDYPGLIFGGKKGINLKNNKNLLALDDDSDEQI